MPHLKKVTSLQATKKTYPTGPCSYTRKTTTYPFIGVFTFHALPLRKFLKERDGVPHKTGAF